MNTPNFKLSKAGLMFMLTCILALLSVGLNYDRGLAHESIKTDADESFNANSNLFVLLTRASYLPWSNWYPVERQLEEGQRAVNWWVREADSSFNQYYQGQSTWNLPGTPTHFPQSSNNNEIDYVINWQCNRITSDPSCEDWDVYREIMSEGSAAGDNSYLEHWARGGRGLDSSQKISWEVYYEPDAFSSCDSTTAKSLGDTSLQNPDIKSPLIMRLPDTVGAEYISPIVCTVIFDDFEIKAENVVDGRTTEWFVVNRILERTTDGNGEALIKAENLYFLNINSQEDAGLDNWCSQNRDTEYCEFHEGSWRGKTREHDGVTGKLHVFEQYWMREVKDDEPLKNGFGSFRWWNWTEDAGFEYDDIQQWSLSTCVENEGGAVSCIYPHLVQVPFIGKP